jgi:hypothetical protein
MRDGIAERKIFRDEKICGGARRHLVRRRRVTNGCERPVFRHEMSRSEVLGAVGNDAASSAQSKHAGGGKTAHLRSGRGELGCAGVDGVVDSEQGVSTGVDSVVGDLAGV